MRLVLGTVAALLILAAPAAAAKVTETDTLGDIRAELSYVTKKDDMPANVRLAVFDGDAQIVDEAVPGSSALVPAYSFSKRRKSVRVVDLDGDGVGEALFDLYSGGAHCCLDTWVYQGAAKVDLYTGNVGYKLKDFDGDGVPEIKTADDNFSGAYSSYAGSLRPVRVLRLIKGAFDDVTRGRAVRPTIKKELRRYKRILRVNRRKARKDPFRVEIVRSALGAITADYCLLGRCKRGYAMLDAEVDRGTVSAGFRGQVHADMRKFGYDT